jgi:hypothetical protein
VGWTTFCLSKLLLGPDKIHFYIGGRWIRTIGTPQNFFGCPVAPQFTFRNINRLSRDRDRWFESISPQRGVNQGRLQVSNSLRSFLLPLAGRQAAAQEQTGPLPARRAVGPPQAFWTATSAAAGPAGCALGGPLCKASGSSVGWQRSVTFQMVEGRGAVIGSSCDGTSTRRNSHSPARESKGCQ